MVCALLTCAALGTARETTEFTPPPEPVRYGRDVRRILSDRCFQCHGADSAARQADLRLDQRAGATAGEAPAIVPGDARASELWRRVTSDDVHERMPPPAAKKRPLSSEELEILERWIDAGAEYEPHWAFVPPVRPPLPSVARDTWPRTDIDRFILSGLEARGVTPAPEADRATLLRRVFLDLTGLPPTVEELDAFLADEEPRAYERIVDRLFGTEPYRSRVGEHLAAAWMDAARFGDTNGIHTDNGRQMWLWRDWVIGAFRDNLPYDRFVTEQLAGDLLPDATSSQKIASGFNRNHVTTDEGGAIAEEYLVEYAVDRAATTSSVFLGLTMGCARCHDHKYDPLTQEDFYGFAGFFNSIEEPGLYTQTADSERAYEPFIEVPSAEQLAELERLATQQDALAAEMAGALPNEDAAFGRFLDETRARAGVAWSTPTVLSASSSDPRVELAIQPDASVLAAGPTPAFEDYTVVLHSDATELRALLLEALVPPDAETAGGAGRASHGNAVVSQLTLEVRPAVEAREWTSVPLTWAWADHTQQNGDFEAGNVIDADPRGWAADGSADGGTRAVLVLTEEPIGFASGTQLRVTLAFRSSYEQHALARIRLRVSPVADTSLLPTGFGRWYRAGPFSPTPRGDRAAVYATAFGPERAERIDPGQEFGEGAMQWAFDGALVDGQTVPLEGGVAATYMGRTIWSPDARSVDVHLGSDDGFALFLNGEQVAANEVDRGVALDQDEATLDLRAGANTLVLKVINTGGEAGYAFRHDPAEHVLAGELPSALLEADAVSAGQAPQLLEGWRRRFSVEYRALSDRLAELEASEADVRGSIPRTMVMRELEEPRPTFVLNRGQYDLPDESRPVARRSPEFLTPLPEGAPRNRLGLAQWLTAEDNALFARVAVNRFWQQVFGAGIVRTSEDLGLQGDWPTHPELLDWLAVEFRESGWDVHGLLRSIVLSSVYRQSSTARPELAQHDPDNRWLASYPRRRLTAEQIRDHALHASGLLVEQVGGPSVKPYQPTGLWGEVAMPASNTRAFEVGQGADLWRRSLYTYWKRAVPPPALSTFDAPTRESCVIRRQLTNTPLQALVLWNDEQFVEAARVLAERILAQPVPEDERAAEGDRDRIVRLFRTCTSRLPEDDEVEAVHAALEAYRERFAAAPEDADRLLALGRRPVAADSDTVELGAWTLVASAVLNLHETLTQD